MRREDKDYVSTNTKFNQSFLISMGYSLALIAKGKTKKKDLFMIRMEGEHMMFKRKRSGRIVNEPYVRREDFFSFAFQRHKALRKGTAERRIEYAVD